RHKLRKCCFTTYNTLVDQQHHSTYYFDKKCHIEKAACYINCSFKRSLLNVFHYAVAIFIYFVTLNIKNKPKESFIRFLGLLSFILFEICEFTFLIILLGLDDLFFSIHCEDPCATTGDLIGSPANIIRRKSSCSVILIPLSLPACF